MGRAVRAMHWIVAEDLALSKFTPFVQVLEEYDVADIKELKVSSTQVNYTSRTTATEFQNMKKLAQVGLVLPVHTADQWWETRA